MIYRNASVARLIGLMIAVGLALSGSVALAGADAPEQADKEQTKADAEGPIDPGNLPAEMTTSLEDLLSDPEGVAPDRAETRCIARRSGISTEILDAEHLLFRRKVGGKAWLNRLTPGCLGLRPDMVLFIEGRGASMCQLDRVRGQTRSSGGASIPSGSCSLGKFEPITELHANTLEDTFKLRRKEMAEARRKERVQKRAERRKQKKLRRAQRKAAQAESTS